MMSLAVMSDTAIRRKLAARPMLWVMPVLAALLTLATNWPVARSVLAGSFSDPDDAMRLVEVRSWLAGQPWFDVTAHRLDPPFGASMHWSRLVDVPNAVLIRALSLVTAQPEAWDRIVLPTLLLVALYGSVLRLATTLVGAGGRWPALLGLFLCGATLVLFAPGRIGHHGPETLALVWATAFLLESFDEDGFPSALAAGALVALMLAMSLETLPYVGLLCAVICARWALRGAPAAPTLRGFCTGLGSTLPILFLAEVPPSNWAAPVCDALGGAHLGAFLIFAAGGAALTYSPTLGRSRPLRLAALVLLAGTAAAFVALFYPDCLGSPFRLVDPLVRKFWLSRVVESLPITTFALGRLDVAAALVLPMLLGGACALWAARSQRGVARDRFLMIAALCGAGLATGSWQVRGFTSAEPFAVLGGLAAAAWLRDRLTSAGLRFSAAFASLAILPFASSAWALVLPSAPVPATPGPGCLSPAALRPLASLPPGRLLAPLQAGAHLLEATPHDVYAAPYHRNNDGNRFELDVFMAPPDRAGQLLHASGVSYVAVCPGLHETVALAEAKPDSLAAALLAGDAPPYLSPVPLAETPFKIWAVIPKP